jgi:ectoine hydroxylase
VAVCQAMSSALLQRRLDELETNGFVVLPNVLGGERLVAVTAAVDRLACDASSEPVHLLEIADRDPALLDLVAEPDVLAVVAAALGWNIQLYHSHIDVHPPAPQATAAWRWHQDGGRQNLELDSPGCRPRLSLKVGFFLTDVSVPGRGNMLVIPRSHRQDTLDRSVDPPPGATSVLAPAGSACIFDRRLWHARSDNRSPSTRKVVFMAFTYRWVRPRREYRTDGIDDPLVRQLLGGARTPAGHWLPSADDVPLRAWMDLRGLRDTTLAAHR